MAALAICAITAAQLKDRTDTQAPPPARPDQPPPADPGMIPLTVPEIARLLTAFTNPPSPPSRAEQHGSAWQTPTSPSPRPLVPPTRTTHRKPSDRPSPANEWLLPY